MEVSGAEDGPVGLTGSARKAVDGLPRDSESFVSQDSGVTHLEGMQGAFLQLNGVRSLNGTESSTGGCLEPGVQEAGPDGERLSSHKASNSLPSGMIPATALRASKASTFPRGAYDSGSLPLHFGKSRHGAETLVTDPSSASRSSLSSLDSELSATLESTSCGATGLGECDDNGELCTRPGSCGDLAGAMPWLEDIKELTLNNPEEGEPRELSMQEIEVGHGAEDKRKRSGFASFIARNWLALRGKDLRSAGSSTLGWKLFGKIPLKESPRKDPKKIQQEYEAKMGRGTSQAALTLPVARRDNKFEPLSTTALILEQRPLSLPAKSEEEMQHHQELYNEMVARARKREVRDAQRQKRLLKERCKKEESIIQAGSIWTTEILPNWEHSCGTRKVRELWWQGLPPSIRGKVWSLAIGNELNITPELYEIFLSRAKEKWRSYSESSLESQNGELGANGADRESSLELITLDISRTFPSLCIFQKGGPYHSTLQNVLGAYTCYRPDIGYVQGMSFLAAVLLLNLDVEEAFITFANLLNKPCQLVFFRVDHSLMLTYFETFELFFEENLPQLFRHFNSSNLTPDLYLIDWIFTLYSKALPLDVASRVWDVFCRDGEEFLFRTALGILRLYRDLLLGLDFVQGARFLTRLPDNVQNQELFAAIGDIGMQSKAGRWSQVFAALQKERKDCDRSGSP